MASKTLRAPAGAKGGALSDVVHGQAINIRKVAHTLAEVQELFIASRFGVRPVHARLIAELAFSRGGTDG